MQANFFKSYYFFAARDDTLECACSSASGLATEKHRSTTVQTMLQNLLCMSRHRCVWSTLLVLLTATSQCVCGNRSASWLNAQLYPCSNNQPFLNRQSWTFASGLSAPTSEDFSIIYSGSNQTLFLQLGNDGNASNSSTCPGGTASCWNVVLDQAQTATAKVQFRLNASTGIMEAQSSSFGNTTSLCLAGDWAHSHVRLCQDLVYVGYFKFSASQQLPVCYRVIFPTC